MDIASERARRKNRSSSNLNHLSLAPLTAKLPLGDEEQLPSDPLYTPNRSQLSYIQGKSAPTTPRLLSRSPIGPRSRSHHRRMPSAPGLPITESKSSTHLDGPKPARHGVSGTMTPGRRRVGMTPADDRRDSDWLLRVGALMSSEARESKGQAWLVSRQSSTSLAGMHNADEEAFELELARERELTSQQASRRGSATEQTPNASRFNSRSHSIADIRGHYFSPAEERSGDDYFHPAGTLSGPDFVNIDEKLEEFERDTTQDDEATIRKLVRQSHAGDGSWLSSMLGWSLFSVEENEEDSEEDEFLADTMSQASRSKAGPRFMGGVDMDEINNRIPAPTKDEGGWKDAAWLLSVASKAMF